MGGGSVDLDVDDHGDIETDICIVGAGPAGITLAHALTNANLRVCLLDRGGLEAAEPERLDVIGRPYPPSDGGRAQRFGGTSHLWGGHCVPLRALHMGARDWVAGGEWPFGLETLAPYYERACRMLGLGGQDFDAAAASRRLGRELLPLAGDHFETTLSRYQPLEFGAAFGPALAADRKIRRMLHARVTRIVLAPSGRAVASLTVKSRNGTTRAVRARRYVLAAGGIENARLLLASGETGVANGTDLVGRNFMEHPVYFSGVVSLDEARDVRDELAHYHTGVALDGHRVRFHLAATESLERRLRIPGFRAEILCVPRLRWAAKRTAGRPAFGSRPATRMAAATLARHPLEALRVLTGRKPSHWCLWLMNNVEQVPNPESRVTLSRQRDAQGEQLAALDWRLSAQDRDGIAKAHAVLATELARAGIGRFIHEMPVSERQILKGTTTARHHMGTTRMSDAPRRGVVDSNLRAHEIDNLHVAGSSVFPSGGWANPTLTIVALSLRLADHLRGDLS
ncbi:GMC family oxidoreductase [Iodidimonas sp. SYSU 1G8]|uniref:GMC family oxidoreductase n=1 Tax=Iodidimonas sp. SYSU 1G8 TaxID=3133967 RepID=UPI0031FE7F52